MHSIEVFLQDRQLIRQTLEGLSDEVFFAVPQGFDNSIAWNLGHIIVTQQALHYRLSGRPTATTKEDTAMFKTGTSPAAWKDNPDVDRLLALLGETGPKLKEDYAAGWFANFHPYTTSTGIKLQSIEDALAFNNFHEGLHLGTILALRNFVLG